MDKREAIHSYPSRYPGAIGLTPVLPLDMKAKLTLVFKQLDRQVVNETEATKADEITAAAPDPDYLAAKNIKENYLCLFNLPIESWQIEFERFTPLSNA